MDDEIPLTETESFRPRFDSLSKDFERLRTHVSELFHSDRLYKEFERSFACIEPAAVQIEDAYFARGLFAEIETYYTYTFEIAGTAPPAMMTDALNRLIDAEQGQRVIRIWRNYLALQKQPYWELIEFRRRGFEKAPYLKESRKSQQKDFRKMIARIPGYKSELLQMMQAAQDMFERAGASQPQLDRLARDRAEVAAEQRTRVTGKPDPRTMDEDIFWQVIGTPADGPHADRIDAIADRLARFNATSIKRFDAILRDINARAHRTDIWALACLLNGGCSDDAFEGFRFGLILLGRDLFQAVLQDPDSFTSLGLSDVGDGLPLLDVPALAYEMRSGKPLRRKPYVLPAPRGPELDEGDFAAHLPKVAAATSA